MKPDELRRLAIRLAKHRDMDGTGLCGECGEYDLLDDVKHEPNCPIAELEAEEARSKLRPVEPKRNPDDCEPGFIRREL
jgi:hypothetical protein